MSSLYYAKNTYNEHFFILSDMMPDDVTLECFDFLSRGMDDEFIDLLIAAVTTVKVAFVERVVGTVRLVAGRSGGRVRLPSASHGCRYA